MRYLVLGANGQVGWELMQRLPRKSDTVGVSRDGHAGIALDLSDLPRVKAMLDDQRPEVIINAAAYTAVDRAEQERDQALRLNRDLPEVLGKWAGRHDALVVHYSTDYVFDGSKPGPYLESDPPAPINVYGESKLSGDQALLASGCAALIFRVSWVYGNRGHNFLLTMQRLMRERDQLRIVADQIGSPTWCGDIATATLSVLTSLPDSIEALKRLSGVYNMAPSGSTSWFGFAQAIQQRLRLDCELEAITTADYPTPAARPKNSVMDCTKLVDTFGVALPPWGDGLAQCLDAA